MDEAQRFVRVGDVWHRVKKTRPWRCVSCGRPIEHRRPDWITANHHCPAKHDAGKHGRGQELGQEVRPTYTTRLLYGFALLHAGGFNYDAYTDGEA